MSKWYIGTDTGSKALAHYAKGASAKDHKWVSRSLKNGHWVYVYNDSKSGDSDSSNLDRVKNQTEQRKSMNAQAENERNKARDTYNTIDRLARDVHEKQRSEFAESSAAIGINPNDITYDTDMANRIRAIEAQKRYEKIIKDAKRQKMFDERYKANAQRVNLEKLIIQYKNAGYKLVGKHVGNGTITNPDDRIVMTNPKTGKTVTLPTARELAKSVEKQEAILRKNENNPSSSTQQQTTPSTKSHEVNSNGFKARPATAADADLFKNKSSAETKNKVNISDHGGNTGIKTEVTKKKKKRL